MRRRFGGPRALLIAALLLACCPRPSQAVINWGISSPDGWPSAQHHQDAAAAMTAAVNRFNNYSPNFNTNDFVFVFYNAGVATADANFTTSDIRFGGTYPNERVSLHELGHTLGMGFWNGNFVNGVWAGPRASALVRQFDGDQAVVNLSGVHHFPYGLNFDNEGGDLNHQRFVAMIYAQRADAGFGPAAHPSSATSVSLTGNDPLGASSFNEHYRWSDGYFSHLGADYSTGEFVLRTPASASSFTFYGDSLTVNNTNGANGGLWFKGVGSSATTTFPNLILDGGYVRHANGADDLFQLDGSVSLFGAPTLDADNGDIRVLAPITGSGALNLRGQSGRVVTLSNDNNIYAGVTDVENVTLVVDGATGLGATTVRSGAGLAGAGLVRGALAAETGATVRVGRAGLPQALPGGQRLVDDFESYPTGQIGGSPNTTGDVWTGVFNGTANADIVSTSRNRVLRVRGIDEPSNTWRGAVTSLTGAHEEDFGVDHGETGTYFFRVRRTGTGFIDTVFGLSDQPSGAAPGTDIDSPWNEYAVLLSIVGDTNDSILRASTGASGHQTIAAAGSFEWLNVWLTVDNASKTFRVASSTGANDGVDSGGEYDFGRRTAGTVGSNPIVTFGIHEARNVPAEIDDLYFVEGVNLQNPIFLTPSPVGETLTVGGDFTLSPGAALQVDIGDGVHDRIEIAGAADLDGVLEVSLDPGFAPELNDTFTVLTSTAITNDLTLGGPSGALFSLFASTASEIVLTAVSGLEGDYNNDGVVDTADFTVWRDNLGVATPLLNDSIGGTVGVAQYTAWRTNFGLGTPGGFATAAVPEPTTACLAAFIALGPLGRRARQPL